MPKMSLFFKFFFPKVFLIVSDPDTNISGLFIAQDPISVLNTAYFIWNRIH